MNSRPNAAMERLLSMTERWAPSDSELWRRWRESLRAELRVDALLPLEALLSGLVAFRQLENHPLSMPVKDFRSRLHALRVAYVWALELVDRLRGSGSPEPRLPSLGEPVREPESSLRALERSLIDALRVTERLLDLPLVDAGAFQASSDLFLRDLVRNPFFRPSDPLEFSNVAEIVRPESLTAALKSWKSETAKIATMIAFLTLLRDDRFLAVADRQIPNDEGVYRAHVVVSAVRRELRTLTRFLLVQGVETFAGELEARLLSLDAHQVAGARTEIIGVSTELTELRESVEALALKLHATVRSALDDALPEPSPENGHALPAERMRNGIRQVRATVKDAAKQVRTLGREACTERDSERAANGIRREIWAFRFILRAFVAKASVASVGVDCWSNEGSLEFVGEFVRHFRVFGLRLSRATDYPRGRPLASSVGALGNPDAIDTAKLNRAVRECVLFVQHLDQALVDVPESFFAPFDKNQAAAELRGYLSAARDHAMAERATAGAFGLTRTG